MDLNASPKKQLEQHIDWLRESAQADSPPAELPWKDLTQYMLDHADFLEKFLIRYVPDRRPELTRPSLSGVIRGPLLVPERPVPSFEGATLVEDDEQH